MAAPDRCADAAIRLRSRHRLPTGPQTVATGLGEPLDRVAVNAVEGCATDHPHGAALLVDVERASGPEGGAAFVVDLPEGIT